MVRCCFTRNQVESLGQSILAGQPDPIVRFRILRDVLCLPSDSSELIHSHSQLLSHQWVKELIQEQGSDGCWNRFHSMDSSRKTHFPTTEIAIRRALILGLDKSDLILEKAIGFMEMVLMGTAFWPDRIEKSEGWPIIMESITTGTLAQVSPSHPAILKTWDYWAQIASCSFIDGHYEPSAEWNAHKAIRGLGTHYLFSRYVLSLLGVRSQHLPAKLDFDIVNGVWNNPVGIGYLGIDMRKPYPFHIFQWVESLEILKHFQSSQMVMAGALDWLWNQRKMLGLWDFGGKVSKSYYFPLSDNWRRPGNRAIDQSTCILSLLRSVIDD